MGLRRNFCYQATSLKTAARECGPRKPVQRDASATGVLLSSVRSRGLCAPGLRAAEVPAEFLADVLVSARALLAPRLHARSAAGTVDSTLESGRSPPVDSRSFRAKPQDDPYPTSIASAPTSFRTSSREVHVRVFFVCLERFRAGQAAPSSSTFSGRNGCTIAAAFEVKTNPRGPNTHELESQSCSWSPHCSRHDVADISAAQRRRRTRRVSGAVSHHGWNLGDFRPPLREAEIATKLASSSKLQGPQDGKCTMKREGHGFNVCR